MHRSGTSMAVGMLSLLGVFLDPAFQLSAEEPMSGALTAQLRTDGYGEAIAFRLLNEVILARAGANWFHVEPFLARRDQPRFARAAIAQMQRASYRELASGYLDLMPQPRTGLWGWKDPRNSLTLPYWLRLFPEARILHVHRRPEAIADSIARRAAQQNATPEAVPGVDARLGNLMRHPGQAIGAISRRLGLASPPPAAISLTDRDYCVRLARRYVEECERFRSAGDRYLELAYEEITADPERAVNRLVEFAELRPPDNSIRRAVAFVERPQRRSG